MVFSAMFTKNENNLSAARPDNLVKSQDNLRLEYLDAQNICYFSEHTLSWENK